MAIVRWKPRDNMIDFPLDVERTFDRMWRMLTSLTDFEDGYYYMTPAVDIKQTDKALIVEVAAPGFNEDEIEVSVHDGILTVSAQKQEESSKEEGDYILKERRAGRLYRKIHVGTEVDEEKATATSKNGILTIELPFSEKSQPKRIPVKAAAKSRN